MWNSNYFTYITTNPRKTVYYIGVTNDLERRLTEHFLNRGRPETFAGKYYCYNLLYYERHTRTANAIEREKEIKLMNREEKEQLIKEENLYLLFLKIKELLSCIANVLGLPVRSFQDDRVRWCIKMRH